MYFVQFNNTQNGGRCQVKTKEIFLGLDIGTNSCGWALTQNDYKLFRIDGKEAWGVRLFDEAETKEKRRLQRTTRRRMVRKKLQNIWLQELFCDEIEKVDDKFFTRLKYSNLWKEDKELMDARLDSKYSLFNDVLKTTYTDKQYYKKYKTVYHLRESLLKTPADDVRLLYLAIHSILTHRGHFLSGANQANESEATPNILPTIVELFEKFSNLCETDDAGANSFGLKCENETFLNNLLKNFDNLKSTRAIKEALVEDLGAKTKLEKEVASIFVSGKSTTDKLFCRISKDEKIEFDFDSDKFEDETYGKLATQLGEEELHIVDLLHQIFSNIQLKKILKDKEYICQAMTQKYAKHHQQLTEFKRFVRKYFPSKMSLFFRKHKIKKTDGKGCEIACNYAKYINSDLEGGQKQYFDKIATQEDFYAFIKKQLDACEVECEYDAAEFEKEKQYFIDLMDKNEFLTKIRSRDNAVIPNGLYIKELKQILKTNREKFPFLTQKDETGLTVEDKIISIIEFRVPYFVGPIGTIDGQERVNGWAEKENNLELRPWTLDKIVDFDKAEDAFIQRMANKCSYLPEEDVLPKDSLLYSKFRVLNELNNLKINGNSISVELKQSIFENLFKNFKKVTAKKLKEFLVAENVISKEDANQVVFSGFDKEFANNYASFVTLKEHFGEEFVCEHENDLEKIIKYHTIFSDKSRLEKRIRREFSYLKEDQIKFLKSLNFSKWGRLSKKLLSGIRFADKKTGELFSVVDAMWQTNNNFMELMGSGFTLVDKINERTKKQEQDLTYEDVEEMYCSPAVKRGAWQAIQIINEIKKKTGKYPDKIFVEVTRHDEKKGDEGRKDSRHAVLEKLYKDKEFQGLCKKYEIEYNKLQEELNKRDNARVRSDRLYLYFRQLGKCMYTGETINIEDIYNDNLYDIDHIIPQSKVKDDSLDNKVLVKKDANRSKADFYPISEVHQDWVTHQRPFWEMLQKKGFISSEKLARLVRVEKFGEEDANDFVNRQLVITNQETKAVVDLLRKVVDNPNCIVFSKARFVSDFRKAHNIFKSRNVNDFHHAKDAYLNVVVGNVLYNRFTKGFWKREKQDCNKDTTANIGKLFYGYVRDNRDGSLVWNGKDDILAVQKVCDKNNCIVSTMPYVNENGMFYDETIYKSTRKQPDSKASINIKGDKNNPLSSIEKYGGYNSMKGAYFMVVESIDKKGKVKKTIETVPILINYQYRNAPDKQQKIVEYLEKENNIKITRVILDKLKYKSLLKIGNGIYKLSAKSGSQFVLCNANQWHIDNKHIGYIKGIEKYLGYDQSVRNEMKEIDGRVVVSPASKKGQKEILISREQNMEIYDLLTKQLTKSIYDLSAFKGVLEILVQGRERFEELSIEDQAKLLKNVILYLGGSQTVDLKLIGGTASQGKIMLSKDITDKTMTLICQSVTGLFQKEIKL